ncbi:hypothetical protein BMS3Bbin15_00473 [archaeon BMS3Bbin15]|nr:hypothetical protein BMS3Bbin15_00473 [archaeon BMS3Bbin15]
MNLDKKLTIATVIVFFAIGAISLYGIYDYSKNIDKNKDFVHSGEYYAYTQTMDFLAFPVALTLLLLLSLCIPKRVIPEKYLISFISIILGLALLLFLKDIKLSLGIILVLTLLLQIIVLLLTLTGRKLRFLSYSYYKKVGSSLIHLGIVAIALSIVQPTWLYFGNINVYWFSTAIISLGMLLIFYFPEKRRVAIG